MLVKAIGTVGRGLKVEPSVDSGQAPVDETLENSRPFGPAAL